MPRSPSPALSEEEQAPKRRKTRKGFVLCEGCYKSTKVWHWIKELPEDTNEFFEPVMARKNTGAGQKRNRDARNDGADADDGEDEVSELPSAKRSLTSKESNAIESLSLLGVDLLVDTNLPVKAGILTSALKKIRKIVEGNEGILPLGLDAELKDAFGTSFRPPKKYFAKVKHKDDAAILTLAKRANEFPKKNVLEGTMDEANWNERVTGQLLAMAEMLSEQVSPYENVTTVRMDTQFAPEIRGMSFSKVIDYALYMKPTLEEKRRIAEIRLECCLSSVNPSSAASIIEKPFGVIIEVKTSDQGASKSLLQLGIWQIGQLNVWNTIHTNFTKSLKQPLFLPMISVRGKDWFMSVFEVRPVRSGQEPEMIFCGEMQLGNLRNLMDLYRVVAVLRVLSEWTNNEFRVWYRNNILSLPAT